MSDTAPRTGRFDWPKTTARYDSKVLHLFASCPHYKQAVRNSPKGTRYAFASEVRTFRCCTFCSTEDPERHSDQDRSIYALLQELNPEDIGGSGTDTDDPTDADDASVPAASGR